MKQQSWYKITNQGEFLRKETISDEPFEEVVTIHAAFFKKPAHKQRFVLRLLIWWSVKHYFKILFKK
jgi:hypothetical protein